ncbi:MAG: cytochrome [Herminiimonas sp.]|nr:cytochrome [Herminiimonas sp.]
MQRFRYAIGMKKIIEACGNGMAAACLRPGRVFWLFTMCLTMAGAAGAQSVLPDTIAQRAVACTACHGKEGRAASDGYYPRIAGKPSGYLYNQLVNFREGRRQYPLMIYMVEHLSDAYLREFAEYFSAQHPPYPAPQSINVTPAVLERGRMLVTSGDASKDVPACIACHGKTLTGVAPFVPGLLGLPRDYLNAQFGAWKNGARRTAAPDCMAQIAARLNVEDISAASVWLASQPIPADTAPLPSAPEKRPMTCGSAPQ